MSAVSILRIWFQYYLAHRANVGHVWVLLYIAYEKRCGLIYHHTNFSWQISKLGAGSRDSFHPDSSSCSWTYAVPWFTTHMAYLIMSCGTRYDWNSSFVFVPQISLLMRPWLPHFGRLQGLMEQTLPHDGSADRLGFCPGGIKGKLIFSTMLNLLEDLGSTCHIEANKGILTGV